MEEIWKDIEGYEGKYQVSNTGKVKSLNFNNTGKPQELKQKVNRYGYSEVKLSKNNKTKNYLVGTLVAKHFLEKKNEDLQVMHIGDINNNDISNLKYAYRSEILYKMYKKGRRKIGSPTIYNISYKNKRYKSIGSIAKDYNMTSSQLHKRLEHGWTLNEALSIPMEREQKILNVRLYEYQGKQMSVKQLSQKYGIDQRNIYRRLARGWSIEEAIEIPLAKTKGE